MQFLDEKNDRRSMERKLPESMYLIVKRNRVNQPWQFPQGKLLESEASLRAVSSSTHFFFFHSYDFSLKNLLCR